MPSTTHLPPAIFSRYTHAHTSGDAILDFLIAARLAFTLRSGSAEAPLDVGEMQVLKSAAVSNDRLAAVAVTWLQAHRFIQCDDLDLRRAIDRYARQLQQLQERALASASSASSSSACGTGAVLGDDPIPGPKALADVVEALIAAVFVDTHGRFEEVARVFLPRVLPRVGGGAGGGQGGDEGGKDAAGDDGESGEQKRVLRAADRARLEQAFPELWRLCDEHFPSGVLDGLWSD